jgi:hypothetical protein
MCKFSHCALRKCITVLYSAFTTTGYQNLYACVHIQHSIIDVHVKDMYGKHAPLRRES